MFRNFEFAEVPTSKSRDLQNRIYLYLLLGFAAYAMSQTSLLASSLLVIPAVAVGLLLWWRHRSSPWRDDAAAARDPKELHGSGIRLGWSRASHPQYAARGNQHVVPFGPYGGGAIYDSGVGLLVALGTIFIAFGAGPSAVYFLLFAVPLGVLIGLALWLKHRQLRLFACLLIAYFVVLLSWSLSVFICGQKAAAHDCTIAC